MMERVTRWIFLLNQLALLLLLNVGALVLLAFGIAIAISIVITVQSSAQGMPLDARTIDLLRSSFVFVLGIVCGIGIRASLRK